MEKDGKRIAIEIETGKSDSVYSIKKDMEAGFEEVVCFCLAEKAKNGNIIQLIFQKRKKT